MRKNPLNYVLDRFKKQPAAAPVEDKPKKRIRIRKPAKDKS